MVSPENGEQASPGHARETCSSEDCFSAPAVRSLRDFRQYAGPIYSRLFRFTLQSWTELECPSRQQGCSRSNHRRCWKKLWFSDRRCVSKAKDCRFDFRHIQGDILLASKVVLKTTFLVVLQAP